MHSTVATFILFYTSAFMFYYYVYYCIIIKYVNLLLG